LTYSAGNNNVGVGSNAGGGLTTGNNNIMIGNFGAADDHTIRIGDVQTSTYIAGISGITVTGGAAVFVNSNGQLGVETSSRRYKEDIEDMGDASEGLLGLRPVTFHYKKPDYDGSKPLEYGLIAEEVAQVYPELVVRGADGQIDSVQYQKLPAMLLNELQKQYQQIQSQSRQIEALQKLEQTNLSQREQIQKLETRLAALEAQLANTTAKVPSGKDLPSGGR
jgi:polyhydroxyalkanoate synthesis regulator phasin